MVLFIGLRVDCVKTVFGLPARLYHELAGKSGRLGRPEASSLSAEPRSIFPMPASSLDAAAVTLCIRVRPSMPLSVAPGLDHPTLPEGQLLYAVGDIHGRLDLLEACSAGSRPMRGQAGMPSRRTLVFLGDYVDRGPDSRGVVETLIGGLPQGFEAHFLKGNHEAILLDFLDDAWTPRSLADEWRRCDDALLRRRHRAARAARRAGRAMAPGVAEALPEAHLRFFRDLQLSVSFGDYLFVHAGVKPGVPLAAQIRSRSDLDQRPVPQPCRAVRQDRRAWTYAGERAGDAGEPHRHRYRRVLHRAADGAQARGWLAEIPSDLKVRSRAARRQGLSAGRSDSLPPDLRARSRLSAGDEALRKRAFLSARSRPRPRRLQPAPPGPRRGRHRPCRPPWCPPRRRPRPSPAHAGSAVTGMRRFPSRLRLELGLRLLDRARLGVTLGDVDDHVLLLRRALRARHGQGSARRAGSARGGAACSPRALVLARSSSS